MPATDDLTRELESYFGFLIDHELDDAYAAEPLNRTLVENKPAFPRAAASTHRDVTQAGVTPLRPHAVSGMDTAALLHEARTRAASVRTLDALYTELEAFQHMPLRHDGGKGVVRFRGTETPELLVVGECPDADEDAAGNCFAGQPGALVDAALKAAGVFEKAMLVPCVPWRPAGGRPLTAEDVELNAPFLHALVRVTQPKAMLLLGASAVSCVLNLDQTLTRLRGRVVSYDHAGLSLPAVATWAPSFLLKQPAAKAQMWRDLLHLVVKAGL
jgi:DNA polymerase